MSWTASIEGGVVRLRSAGKQVRDWTLGARECVALTAVLNDLAPQLEALIRDEVNREARGIVADLVLRTNLLVAGRQYETATHWVLPVEQEHLVEAAAYRTPDRVEEDEAGLFAVFYGPVKLERVTV